LSRNKRNSAASDARAGEASSRKTIRAIARTVVMCRALNCTAGGRAVENLWTMSANVVDGARREIFFATDRQQIPTAPPVDGGFACRFA
jgi:hypothetical protein